MEVNAGNQQELGQSQHANTKLWWLALLLSVLVFCVIFPLPLFSDKSADPVNILGSAAGMIAIALTVAGIYWLVRRQLLSRPTEASTFMNAASVAVTLLMSARLVLIYQMADQARERLRVLQGFADVVTKPKTNRQTSAADGPGDVAIGNASASLRRLDGKEALTTQTSTAPVRGEANQVVALHRQAFPNDPRSDDEITLAYGESDPAFSRFPDAVRDFARITEQREGEQAIRLAQAADTMYSAAVDHYARLYVHSNQGCIKADLQGLSGDLKVIGWKASSFGEGAFLVSYAFRQDGRLRTYYFEVNTRAEIVRDVRSDSALRKKYGVTDEDSPPASTL